METHPELIFWAFNEGKPIAISKKKPQGRKKRLEILELIFKGVTVELNKSKNELRGKVAIDDLIDACACLAAARFFMEGRATKVPLKPERDKKRLRMEINYPQVIDEDAYWAAEADKRSATFDRRKAIPHKLFWRLAMAKS